MITASYVNKHGNQNGTGKKLGLSELGKLDWIKRCQQQTAKRINAVMRHINPVNGVGVLRLADIEKITAELSCTNPKCFLGENFIVAVLKLYGFKAERVDIGIAFQLDA